MNGLMDSDQVMVAMGTAATDLAMGHGGYGSGYGHGGYGGYGSGYGHGGYGGSYDHYPRRFRRFRRRRYPFTNIFRLFTPFFF